jgi:hypothetical protein
MRIVFMVIPPTISIEIGLYPPYASTNKTKRERMTSHGLIQIEGFFMREGLDLNRDGNRGISC